MLGPSSTQQSVTLDVLYWPLHAALEKLSASIGVVGKMLQPLYYNKGKQLLFPELLVKWVLVVIYFFLLKMLHLKDKIV